MTSRRALLSAAAAAVGASAVGAAAWWVPRGESAGAPPIPRPPKRPGIDLLPAASGPIALPPGSHRGMNLAHLHRGGRGYGSAASARQLAQLAALGVTHVALTPFGYIADVGDVALRWGSDLDRSLSDDALLAEARAARALGLRVTLKPHIWSRAFWTRGQSRQDIRPRDRDGGWAAWFDGYTAFARHYASLAAKMDAALYVVGLEYLRATAENPGAWAQVAAACREVYAGPVTYAANWWREAELFADWAAFDLIGVNAYRPLSDLPDPDRAALVAGWAPFLRAMGAVARDSGRSVLFCEAGLPALAGAAAQPWSNAQGGAPAPTLQARAYDALLAAAAPQPWFRGVYWWKWFTDAGADDDPYSPMGQPAEQVLRAWWAPDEPAKHQP